MLSSNIYSHGFNSIPANYKNPLTANYIKSYTSYGSSMLNSVCKTLIVIATTMSCSLDERMCCPKETSFQTLAIETIIFGGKFCLVWIVAHILHFIVIGVLNRVENSLLPSVWRYLTQKYYAAQRRCRRYRREWTFEFTRETQRDKTKFSDDDDDEQDVEAAKSSTGSSSSSSEVIAIDSQQQRDSASKTKVDEDETDGARCKLRRIKQRISRGGSTIRRPHTPPIKEVYPEIQDW